MPAVQKVRDAAALTQCINNVKQIGLATHNYEGAEKKIPGVWFSYRGGYGNEAWRTLYTELLPYLDQQSLYDAGSSVNPVVGPNGYGWQYLSDYVAVVEVNVYLCPADGSNPTHFDPNFGYGGSSLGTQYANTNYRGNLMVYDPNINRSLVVSMPDGLSNTIMTAHCLQQCNGSNVGWGAGNYVDWGANPSDTGTQHPIAGFGWETYAANNLVRDSSGNYAGAPADDGHPALGHRARTGTRKVFTFSATPISPRGVSPFKSLQEQGTVGPMC